jgi:acetylornithine deacetylase/succinyl-diaminopimelate desuccinylase-like protein
MWGGYEGPGSKTVTPSEAHAKVSCRLVPDQDPHRILTAIVAHLHNHLPPGVRIEIRPGDHASLPYRIAGDHPALAAAAAALRDVYGVPPLFVRMGGTVPVCEELKQTLGLDTVFFSWSVADEDFHAPNEFFRINRIGEGLAAWARLWQLLGRSDAVKGESLAEGRGQE